MSRPVVPIGNLQRRIPEQGRIRFGVRTDRAMKALDTFRFTSHDREALAKVAELYGGEVREWSGPKVAGGQYEIITEASEIRVVLPPDPLGGTPIYEQWSGGGCQRRCDGLSCEVWVKGPEGPEPTQTECKCAIEGALACEPHTRLSVVLPELRFGGTWRLETKSWNAAAELPGMVEMVEEMKTTRGLPYATLALRQRRTVTAGETRHFTVPVLGLPESVEALAEGRLSLGAGQRDEPALAPAEYPELEPADDDVVEAEIVDHDGASELDELHSVADSGPKKNRALKAARDAASEMGVDPPGAFDEIGDDLAHAALVAL